MGLGLMKKLEEKISGTPEERASKKRLDIILKREAEQARWEGKRAGIKKMEYEKGKKEVMGGSGLGGSLGKLGSTIGNYAEGLDKAWGSNMGFGNVEANSQPRMRKKKKQTRQKHPYEIF